MVLSIIVVSIMLIVGYIVSLSIGCGEDIYWKYLEERSPAFRKMESGKHFYVFLVWLFTPIWVMLFVIWRLLIAILDFCGAVFDFGNAFRFKADTQIDFETLKREIEEMTK